MTRVSCVCFAVLCLLAGGAAQAGELAETLIGLETALCKAFQHQDLGTIERLVAEDAVVAEQGRLFTQRAESVAFHVDDVVIEDFKLSDFRVIPFSDDVAAVYMRADTYATRGGEKLPSVNFVTTIWARRGSQWQAVYSTSYSPASLEEKLIALETALCQAFQDKDLATIKRLVAEDAVVAEEGRVFTQRADSVAFHIDDVVIEDFKLSDFTVTRTSDDTAVVNMRADTKATRGGKRLSEVNFVSTVWRHRDGQWQAVHSTSYSPQGY